MTKKPKGRKYRNLFARGGAIYYQRIVGGRRIVRSCQTDDWEVAAAGRDLYEQQKGIGRLPFITRQTATFREFSAQYLKEAMSHLAPTTKHDRTLLLWPGDSNAKAKRKKAPGLLLQHFGEVRLENIGKPELVRWWTTQVEGRGVTRKTGRNYLDALSAVLGYACDLDLIATNPCDELRAKLRRESRTKAGRAESDPSRNIRPRPGIRPRMGTDDANVATVIASLYIERT